MNFDEYQEEANSLAIYPRAKNNIFYPGLGISGEAGEVSDKIKKLMRDGQCNEKDLTYVIPCDKVIEISYELGDVLWYIAAICMELGVDMSTIAELNLQKLNKRKNENKLHGEGDNR